ncbi:DUF4328 domain-containing protein [Embleya sp. NPDC050493]|uniref:DUF4328 domain-containing protein n=1 Tax=Embleya sp. NPDC050493 TaxID=3363989 RepID=UPI003787BABF
MLCPSCGARSTLPDRCTNCGHQEYAPPADATSSLDLRFARFGPAATPPPGWYAPVFRPLGGLATALYVLLGVTAVLSLLAAIALFHRANLVDQTLHGGWLSADPDAANRSIGVWWGLASLAIVAVMVVFVIWFHRARCNVEVFPPSAQHLSRGWAIGGWFCPVVNLWFPPLIAHDIWKASDPRAPLRGGLTPGRHPLLWSWWAAYVAANIVIVFGVIGRKTDGGDDPIGSDAWTAYHESYRTADTAAGWAFLLLIPAAGLAIAVVARITTFQSEHERGFHMAHGVHPMAMHGMGPVHSMHPTAPMHGMGPMHATAPMHHSYPMYAAPSTPPAPMPTPTAAAYPAQRVDPAQPDHGRPVEGHSPPPPPVPRQPPPRPQRPPAPF